jgi:hypothetical protein
MSPSLVEAREIAPGATAGRGPEEHAARTVETMTSETPAPVSQRF